MSEVKDRIHDVLIIGAGPSGLAVAARLCESSPSSVFSDSEHQRYHRFKANSTRRTPKLSKSAAIPSQRLKSSSQSHNNLDIAVLDASGDRWMSSWNSKFKALKIKHLRSPMFFHPDPRDKDGLLSFAYRTGRESELKEINGVIGKALSKRQRNKGNGIKRQQETTYLDERDRPDYFRPSQALFKDFCSDIVSRYDLSNMVEKSEVLSLNYEESKSESSYLLGGVFTLQTTTGVKKSRIVVLAVGPAHEPTLPPNCPFTCHSPGSVSHAFTNPSLPPHIIHRISSHKTTKILVIGGGLTSAQITCSFLQSGVSKVYHLMRGPLKVKNFDVGLEWVGKYRNFFMAEFWGAEGDEERSERIKAARKGGSVNPEYHDHLQKYIQQGSLTLKEYTTVSSASWDTSSQKWTIQSEPAIEELPAFDHVVYATGITTDVSAISALKPLFEKKETTIEISGGLPCINDDLMWNSKVPLFVAGRLAALRLGPAAQNLVGARMGGERICGRIGELIDQRNGTKEGNDSGYNSSDQEVDGRRLGLGLANQFEILGLRDDEEQDGEE